MAVRLPFQVRAETPENLWFCWFGERSDPCSHAWMSEFPGREFRFSDKMTTQTGTELWHHRTMKKKGKSSKKSVVTHKLGANRREAAKRERKLDKNFKQSRDVREDRSVRQLKTSPKGQQEGR